MYFIVQRTYFRSRSIKIFQVQKYIKKIKHFQFNLMLLWSILLLNKKRHKYVLCLGVVHDSACAIN